MKTSINIIRVFKRDKMVIRKKLIRLLGDSTLSNVITTFGGKLCVLSVGSITKATSRIRLYHKFGTYLSVMNRRHGTEFVVKYLKACNLAVSKFLAGEPFKSLREIEPDLPLPRLTRSGLPVIIGTRDRRSLHANSHRVIRLGLTLFSLYRVILIPAKTKLNTITDPFSGNERFLEIVGNWMEHKGPTILRRFQDDIHLEKVEKFSMAESSSPICSKSGTGMLTDISLLKNSPSVFRSLVFIMNHTCADSLRETFNNLSNLLPSVHSPKFEYLNMSFKKDILEYLQCWDINIHDLFVKFPAFGLGQLQTKVEPAGKMRVFAMVDSGTQTVLLPLHVYLTKLLKEFGNDGTDSHNAAFERVMERSTFYGCSFGYDLSAATDRLPIHLQVSLLAGIFGREFADHWANLLIGRPYYLFQNFIKEGGFLELTPFKYSVGQPMGARSSFTMLGLTHHMLVQYAAHLINPSTSGEDRYEIVGDDIIIFNKDLAESYLKVMELIGVPINKSKSVVSVNKPVAEFVKRICLNGKDVSAFSGKQFMSQNSMLGRISTVIGLFQKEISLADKAISVFHTVLKERTYDSRVYKDSLALICLYFTYAFKSNMSIQNILRALFLQNPVLEGPKLVFNSFNFHEIGAKVKQMIQTGRAPVDASFHPEILAINHFMTGLNFSRVIKLRESGGVDKIRFNQQTIIKYIMGHYGEVYKTDQLTLDIRNELLSWMRIQDPIIGTQGYPWITGYDDMEYLTERYQSLSHLEISGRLYQECLGKLSFLNIWRRVNVVNKGDLQDVIDPSLLRDLVKVAEKVKINRQKQDAIKKQNEIKK